jgi:hypothetical protein
LIFVFLFFFVGSNHHYGHSSSWPEGLLSDMSILKLVQILAVLATDEEFIDKLNQHELNVSAAMRSFQQ